jgi:hypothetical protein
MLGGSLGRTAWYDRKAGNLQRGCGVDEVLLRRLTVLVYIYFAFDPF